jgi:hypothetical protein
MHQIMLPGTTFPVGRYVMLLSGYFDESLPEDLAPVTVFAGLISTPARWEAFAEKWAKMLLDFDLSPDPGYFHMNQFNARQGRYSEAAMPEQKYRALLEVVLNAIDEAAIAGAGIALPEEIAKQFVAGGGKDAYYFAAFLTFAEVVEEIQRANRSGRNPEPLSVAYTFDWRLKRGHIGLMMDELLEDEEAKARLCMESFTYGKKEKFLPLQAADVVAYELRKDWQRHGTDQRMRYPLRRLQRLLNDFSVITEINGKTLTREPWPWLNRQT